MTHVVRLQEFQESTSSTFLGVIPVGGIARTEHEEVVVSGVDRYDDHAMVQGHLLIGPDHPHRDPQVRGERPRLPRLIIMVEDDLATDYATLQVGGGGGMYTFDFRHKMVPSIPSEANTITILIADLTWDGPVGMPVSAEDAPPMRWRIRVNLTDQISATPMVELP